MNEKASRRESARGGEGAARGEGAACGDGASSGAVTPRFLVDGTAGKLARWLRVLGFDAVYAAHCEPPAIARLARQSGRMVLTRNTEVAGRLANKAILLESEHLRCQLEQVIDSVGKDACRPFSRCNVCNRKLERVEKEAVRGRVPEFVYATQEAFSCCPECGRYFWHGTHYANMLEQVRIIVEGDQDESE